MATIKSRYWLMVFYPESCPAEWQDIVSEWQMGVYVSPLHDSDLTKDGEPKKPHYHGILCFDGPATYTAALSLASQLGCATVKKCNSLSGSVRYLCHLDSPDKFQYDIADIVCFGGVGLGPLTSGGEDVSDKNLTLLVQIIDDNSITEFAELVRYVIKNRPELFGVVRGNAYFLRAFLSSSRGMMSKS